MKERQVFPQIINVTDLRYRWAEVEKQLEKSEQPILVLEHSTPKAILYPFEQVQEVHKGEDPLTKWREKYADQFSGWDATAAIRKQRDSRWNLS